MMWSALILALLLLTGPGQPVRAVQGVRYPPGTAPNWKTHTNSLFGFVVKYPDDYVILPESERPTGSNPPRVHRVRFQEKAIASGPVAQMEPPRLTVEVFHYDGQISLRSWLGAVGRLPPDAEISSVTLQGAGEGVRVVLARLIAPNEFIYIATERYVYGLTAVGTDAGAMLASFRLVGHENHVWCFSISMSAADFLRRLAAFVAPCA
jgi:hypothetical protein